MLTPTWFPALVASLATFAPANDSPTLEQRLDKLAESLEAARAAAHVPGMSIAIVQDGELVWARGFGLADVALEKRADESTVYAIGSATKAFTATLIGMLVDEGKAGWDDPVSRYLPYFDLSVRSDDPQAVCTLRDLLSHRAGFARMGVLALGRGVSREELLRTAAGAEPWGEFRKSFHYCNVTYLAAGEAAGAAAASTWDQLMAERIFGPLEMTSSTVSVSAVREDARLALGYRWEAAGARVEHVEMLDPDNIAPAGAMTSSVVDMAQWVRLQLGHGALDGVRLISEERLLDTWTPQIEMGPGVSYGLGWMLREHGGRRVVEHGGNIDGFTAQVGLMPEQDLGYVLLMNLDMSPLREASIGLVFDALLEEWPDDGAPADVVDLDAFTGVYVANFAKFRDEEFEVRIDDDQLALHIPSQRTVALERPDAEGRWQFAGNAQLAVSFERDAEEAVIGLRVHQGGFRFEVPRKGLEVAPEAPAAELEKYVGTYVRAEGGKRVKISIERGLLTMEDKGNLLAFETPDAEGHASLRARADQGATFELDAEGNAESFIYHGNAGDKLFTRLADSPGAELPTLAELHALRKVDARRAALKASGGTRASGSAWVAQAGLRGTVTLTTQGSDRYAQHLDFGKFGRISAAASGGEAWSYDSTRGVKALQGDELTQALLEHPGAVEGDWNEYFDSAEVVARDTVNDRPVFVVRLKKSGLPSRTCRVDAETGDVLRMNQMVITAAWPRLPVAITYSEFEESNGIRRARRVEIENPVSGRTVLTFDKFESGLQLGAEVFTLAQPDAASPTEK